MDQPLASDDEGTVPPPAWRYHVSVDDVFESLFRAVDSKVPRTADELLTFLTSLHASYDCSIELYVFAQGQVEGHQRSLTQVPDVLRKEFQSRPWLRVGPHGECYETPPFEQTLDQQKATFEQLYQQIDRFAGYPSRSRWLRLHYFSECYEMGPYLRAQGVESLLLTDRDAVAYKLDEEARLELECTGMVLHHKLALRRSFCRMEVLEAEGWDDATIESVLRERLMLHGYVALFTHELDLKRVEVRDTLKRCVHTLKRLSATSL